MAPPAVDIYSPAHGTADTHLDHQREAETASTVDSPPSGGDVSWLCASEKALQARPAEVLDIAAAFFSSNGATDNAAQAMMTLGSSGFAGFTGEMATGFGTLVQSVGESMQSMSVAAGQAQAACQAAGRTLNALEAESDALFVTASEQQAELDALSAEAIQWETTVYWRGRAVSVAAQNREIDPGAYERAVQSLRSADATLTRIRNAVEMKRAELTASQVMFDRIREDQELVQSDLTTALSGIHGTLDGEALEFSAADISGVAAVLDIFDLAAMSIQVNNPATAAARNALLDAREALATVVGLPTDAGDLLVDAAGAAWDGLIDPFVDFLASDVLNFWTGGDDGFPWGQLGAAGLKANRLAQFLRTGVMPVFNTGLPGRTLATTLGRFPALAPAGTWLSGATPFFTKVGIVGGTVATGVGAWEIYQQGNPIDAFQAEGAGYVADIASTTFAASSTLVLLAPTAAPILVPIAIGAAVIWVGAEVWDEWGDDISAWTGERWDELSHGTSVLWDAGTHVVASTWNDGVESIEQTWDVTTAVADAAWDASSEFVTDAGETLVDVRDAAVEAGAEFVSDASEALGDVRDAAVEAGAEFASDVGNTALDVGGAVLDVGGDVISRADPRNWF